MDEILKGKFVQNCVNQENKQKQRKIKQYDVLAYLNEKFRYD